MTRISGENVNGSSIDILITDSFLDRRAVQALNVYLTQRLLAPGFWLLAPLLELLGLV
jgi:hypothetical protein